MRRPSQTTDQAENCSPRGLGERQQTQVSMALSEIKNENVCEDWMALFDPHALPVQSLMFN